jgi:hypothetical protein
VRHLKVVPHGRRGRPHDHACAQTEHASARVSERTGRQTHASARHQRSSGSSIGLHLESAVADLVSKPTTRLSMGTKIPPPPTPLTVPNAEPRKPTTVTTTTRQLNARSYGKSSTRSVSSDQNLGGGAAAQEGASKRLTGQTRGEREDSPNRTSPVSSRDGSAAETTKQARTAAQAPPAARNPRVLVLLTRPYSELAFPSMQEGPASSTLATNTTTAPRAEE